MRLKRILFGNPLPSHVEHHQRLNIPLGLAVFAADILSSSAYATEEILIALMATSVALYANALSIPVAIAICLLLTIVVISYRQVIRAYPESGGAYIVAKENLGPLPSLVAGAALMIDYILTVAVSVSAGVAALTSTGYLAADHRVQVAVGLVVLVTFINLRGMRESGRVLAVPAYLFVLSMLSLIAWGVYQALTGQVSAPPAPLPMHAEPGESIQWNAVLILALLKAFSHGCAALTGAESVSNGVKAFREPEDVNANKTLVIMASLLATIFIGLTFLAYQYRVLPSHDETVVSQIARHVFGGDTPLYLLVQFATMIILVLAANTSFAGFPRLTSLLARDGYMPRQLMTLGDKLVFSNGIALLGFASAFLIWAYQADTHALIPLYAVGVFITFTLAQTGMVVYQVRNKKSGWRWGLAVNATGALVTGLVAVLLAVEKFLEGAWIILVAMPIFIMMFYQIKAHYLSIGRQLTLPAGSYCPRAIEHTVLVLVSSLHRGTLPALEYAKTISDNVEAVHVELSPAATANLKQSWEDWGCGVPLTVLKSSYRSLNEPLMHYIDEVEQRYEHDLVTIIVPEFVTKKWWHNLLHNQSSLMLKALLRFKKGKVVTTVRYFLEE